MSKDRKILKIALDVPVNKLFDYVSNDSNIKIGQYVKVPFGSRRLIGVCCEIEKKSLIPVEKLKTIASIESEVIFDEPMFKLLYFVSDYYHYPIGQTIMSVVPSRIKKNSLASRKKELLFKANVSLTNEAIENLPPRQLRLRKVAYAILNNHLRQKDLNKLVSNGVECIRKLESMGLISSEIFVRKLNRTQINQPDVNKDQKKAIDKINSNKLFKPWLIHGVTASGKTEIYMNLITEFLKNSQSQALVLVPEINLTPQLEERFQNRFFDKKIVVLHSYLSDIERLDNWREAKSGNADIVIGTRLGVFTPMPHLKIIIIDEEHDASFKQSDGLRYHARDVAMMRAKNLDIPVVMGSATPSLETWYKATTGKQNFQYLKLTSRAVDNATLPNIQTIQVNDKTKLEISKQVIDAIQNRIDKKEQTIVFINRRGYSPVLICSACGWVAECERCSSRLVVHLKKKRLKCHHCGFDQKIINSCMDCGNTDLYPLGTGTQKIEDVLKYHFPIAKISRVDRDTTNSKKSIENLYLKMNNRDIDIVIGTQMLSKGHDFPYVTLVVVLDADNALYSPDFRASERLFSQLMQVSGRAGRGKIKGEVLIQSVFPNHNLFDSLKAHDFDLFANQLLSERKSMGLSPFSYNAVLMVQSKNLDIAKKFIFDVSGWVKGSSRDAIDVLGPSRPPMERLKGFERFHLHIQAPSRKELHIMLKPWISQINQHPFVNRVKWNIDVDPTEF
ncbi:MAG: primosomal protein N' [Nitrosomonadales bacterium]|nr:primosomal protein N' [Nitrosomonadales bacterium]